MSAERKFLHRGEARGIVVKALASNHCCHHLIHAYRGYLGSVYKFLVLNSLSKTVEQRQWIYLIWAEGGRVSTYVCLSELSM